MAVAFWSAPTVHGKYSRGNPPRPTGMVMIEFPSMENARAWYNDPDYRSLIKLRRSSSTLDLILVESL